ncbi:aspartic peptidase domain-containing protein [Paraphoma chrysanthemicola]|uniref:Aspartic peptidase domain-containing protein n=1 Tax=Paraphoma chrysanthemicola TaxID=798071 RepID=A0A8K0VY86_9PLEO|nr:aspartic peptidase domain-containing protein [Paraphoma chrysanthemicola]
MYTQWRITLFSILAKSSLATNPSAHTISHYEVPLVNDLAHQRYNISLAIGNPSQEFNLLFDTGSADIWVPRANSTGCAPNCPTSFDPRTSSSIINTTIPYLAIYGLTPDPANSVTGFYYDDTISVAGLPSVQNATFAVGNVPKPLFTQGNWGIFGAGSPYQEALTRPPNPHAPYTPIWERLALAAPSGTKKMGVWLNAQNASQGSVQFGGIDRRKYVGELLDVPVLLSDGLSEGWRVNVTSVVRVTPDGKKKALTAGNFSLDFTIDTGSPNMYLPTMLYDAIVEGLNATEVQNGAPYVPCSLRTATSGSLEFGFPTTKKAKEVSIRVPISEIVYPPGYPVTVPAVPDRNGEKLCYFGIVPTDGPIRLLGATFIRSAYLVFDAEKQVVSMARTRWRVR